MPSAGLGLLEKLEREFQEIDQRQNGWNTLFGSIGLESRNPELTSKESLKPRNRALNRYRNVSPYDHSRVVLLDSSVDYINANLVRVPMAGRRYILGQGPLDHTCGHFWLMVWQQESRAVVMLNRVIENNVVKCHQYWPEKVDVSIDYEEVGLRVTLVDERSEGFYIVRTICIKKLLTGDSRRVAQFHYTTWPDFQVPASPAAFLNFLAAVRASGGLESDVGPAVIHCSAGIGRSGTFCLIDSCLLLVEKGLVTQLDVRNILLELRTYRMGLIQTPDQLRFSFLGIIRGAKKILSGSGFLDASVEEEPEDVEPERKQNNVPRQEYSSEEEEEEEDDDGKPPTPPPRSDSLTRSFDSSSSPPTVEDSSDGSGDELPPASSSSPVANHKPILSNDVKVVTDEAELRKRQLREGRRKATEELVSAIKTKQREAERRQERVATVKELIPKCLMGVTIIGIVAVFSYKYWT